MQNKIKDKNIKQNLDPRQTLLQYDNLVKNDPIFFGNAYNKTQPTNILHEETYEEEEENFRKKQKNTI